MPKYRMHPRDSVTRVVEVAGPHRTWTYEVRVRRRLLGARVTCAERGVKHYIVDEWIWRWRGGDDKATRIFHFCVNEIGRH